MNSMVVFGGVDLRKFLADTWLLSFDGGPSWTKLTDEGPQARAYHSMVAMSSSEIMLFGGRSDTTTFNDTWILDLAGEPAWRKIPTSSGPSPRFGHGAIYDPLSDRVLIFGGEYDGTLRNDTWSFSLSDGGWLELVPGGSLPEPRSFHGSAYDHGRKAMVIFGGFDGSYRSDTWTLSLVGDSIWEKEVLTTNPPFPRTAASIIYDESQEEIVMFGGFVPTFPHQYFNEVWALSESQWVDLSTTEVPNLGHGRAGHISVLDSNQNEILVHGGVGSGIASESIWAYSLENHTWRKPLEVGTVPPHIFAHGVIDDLDDDNRFIIFGGYRGCVTPDCWYNEVWTCTIGDQLTWNELQTTGSAPVGRQAPSVIHDRLRDRLIVFGGESESGLLNDVWTLNLSASPPSWIELSPMGNLPSPRFEHVAVYDSLRDRMVVFGGSDPSIRNDTWFLSLRDPPTWTKLTQVLETAPGPRGGHSAVLDVSGERMIITGGYGWADTWALSLSGTETWSKLEPLGTAPLRSGQSAVFDHVERRVIIYGGRNVALLNDVLVLELDYDLPEGLLYLSSERISDHVVLRWETADPSNSSGFHVYRQVGESIRERLTDDLLRGGPIFEYLHTSTPDDRLVYWILEMGSSGEGAWHGPTVVPMRTYLLLRPNRPNPFGSCTLLSFQTKSAGHASLSVFDVVGRIVDTPVDEFLQSGDHQVAWQSNLPAGVYFLRLSSQDGIRSRKIVKLN
jgi:hypothetical protein